MTNLGLEVDRRVRDHIRKHPSTDYVVAMRAVLAADEDLKRAYAAPDDVVEPDAAGLEVDRQTRAYMDENGCDYSTA